MVKAVMEKEVLKLLSRSSDWHRRGQKNPETALRARGKTAMG